ncbi:MAG: MotA/TolQ/ExbB proton channel family protein [Persephonella sp.]|nr:MotA/TolQ/ExbB proton channel family protein [Persephonella sp.]
MKVAAEEIARTEIPKLEGYVNAIGAIAAIAPLLGFLGTVTGMIQVFEALSLEGLSNPEVLSSGISQALITTAFGLSYCYTIPCNLLVFQV